MIELVGFFICNQLSTTFFNNIYLETRLKVDILLKTNNIINIILDKSKN